MSNKKFKIGDKVKYVGDNYFDFPNLFPTKGTFGILVNMDGEDCEVTWEDKNIGADGSWFVPICDIEKVEKRDMTNKEIWEMLENKMRKNGLKPCGSCLLFTGGISNVYAWEDVHNAIALAYKVGYLRSQKGRPFKIGEKKIEEKKGGHWEPVDPKNLPEEGTRVRYARKFSGDIFNIVSIGTEGIVEYFGEFFGAKFNKTYFCSCEHPDRFDVWVEDDE